MLTMGKVYVNASISGVSPPYININPTILCAFSASRLRAHSSLPPSNSEFDRLPVTQKTVCLRSRLAWKFSFRLLAHKYFSRRAFLCFYFTSKGPNPRLTHLKPFPILIFKMDAHTNGAIKGAVAGNAPLATGTR